MVVPPLTPGCNIEKWLDMSRSDILQNRLFISQSRKRWCLSSILYVGFKGDVVQLIAVVTAAVYFANPGMKFLHLEMILCIYTRGLWLIFKYTLFFISLVVCDDEGRC